MSSQERRKARQAQFDAECAAREKEDRRRAALSLWERIEESGADDKVKEILHMLASHGGLE